jgi:hypothetical protein
MFRFLCFVLGMVCVSACSSYSSAFAETPSLATGSSGESGTTGKPGNTDKTSKPDKHGSLGALGRVVQWSARASLPPSWRSGIADILRGGDKTARSQGQPDEPVWHASYQEAMDVADREGRMLLVFFHRPGQWAVGDRFEAETLANADIRKRLAGLSLVRLPLDATIRGEDKPVALLKHEAFVEMAGRPGLAIVDLAHKDAGYYGAVVSVFPFLGDRAFTVDQMRVILDLPPGTLTQRTMIYAVRTHPEHPASTQGQFHPVLAEEAESAAEYQARIGRQGHHSWETRFHRINARLANGLTSSEVCAESWPGQGLLESAIECVRCWRLSSGHWAAVSAKQQCFGYDIKRGVNGIWYATGIFGH